MEKFERQLYPKLKSIDIREGDILVVVIHPSDHARITPYKILHCARRLLGSDKIVVVASDSLDDVRKLSDGELKTLGLARIEK